MLKQPDWRMDPEHCLSLSLYNTRSKEIDFKIYKLRLQHLKAVADLESQLYGEILSLLARKKG